MKPGKDYLKSQAVMSRLCLDTAMSKCWQSLRMPFAET